MHLAAKMRILPCTDDTFRNQRGYLLHLPKPTFLHQGHALHILFRMYISHISFPLHSFLSVIGVLVRSNIPMNCDVQSRHLYIARYAFCITQCNLVRESPKTPKVSQKSEWYDDLIALLSIWYENPQQCYHIFIPL